MSERARKRHRGAAQGVDQTPFQRRLERVIEDPDLCLHPERRWPLQPSPGRGSREELARLIAEVQCRVPRSLVSSEEWARRVSGAKNLVRSLLRRGAKAPKAESIALVAKATGIGEAWFQSGHAPDASPWETPPDEETEERALRRWKHLAMAESLVRAMARLEAGGYIRDSPAPWWRSASGVDLAPPWWQPANDADLNDWRGQSGKRIAREMARWLDERTAEIAP